MVPIFYTPSQSQFKPLKGVISSSDCQDQCSLFPVMLPVHLTSTIPPTHLGADWQCLCLISMERGPWQIFSLTMSECLNSGKHQKRAANVVLTIIRRSISQFTSRTYPINHLSKPVLCPAGTNLSSLSECANWP